MKRKDPIVREELEWVRDNGIPIDVCGVSYANQNTDDVMKAMERGNYMMDYEGDELGRIVALHINRVRTEKPSYKSLRY